MIYLCTQKPKVEVFALTNTGGGQKRVQTLAVNFIYHFPYLI